MTLQSSQRRSADPIPTPRFREPVAQLFEHSDSQLLLAPIETSLVVMANAALPAGPLAAIAAYLSWSLALRELSVAAESHGQAPIFLSQSRSSA